MHPPAEGGEIPDRVERPPPEPQPQRPQHERYHRPRPHGDRPLHVQLRRVRDELERLAPGAPQLTAQPARRGRPCVEEPVLVHAADHDEHPHREREDEAPNHSVEQPPRRNPRGVGDLQRLQAVPRAYLERFAKPREVGPPGREQCHDLSRPKDRAPERHHDHAVHDQREGNEPEARLRPQPRPHHVVDDDEAGNRRPDRKPRPRSPVEIHQVAKRQHEGEHGPPVRQRLVLVLGSPPKAEDRSKRPRQVLPSHPQRPRPHRQHCTSPLIRRRRKRARPPLLRPVRCCSRRNRRHRQRDPHHPEEPAGKRQLLRDQVGHRHHPRQQPQLPRAQPCQRPHPLPRDQRHPLQRNTRHRRKERRQPAQRNEAERQQEPSPEHPRPRQKPPPPFLPHQLQRHLRQRKCQALVRDPLPLQQEHQR